MLSAAERVVLRRAQREGFISEAEMTRSQCQTAVQLKVRGLLAPAGQGADRTPMWRITEHGLSTLQAWG